MARSPSSWVVVVALAVLGLASVPCSGRESGVPPQEDLICGPRCVQMILRSYGVQKDLIDITRAIQWPDLEGGCDLASICTYLGNHGVHAYPLQGPPEAAIDWPHPVLVHLIGPSGVGHYAVWLPAKSPNLVACYWDGLRGYHRSVLDFGLVSSGVVVVTSPTPTARAEAALRPGLAGAKWLMAAIAYAIALAGYVPLRNIVRRVVRSDRRPSNRGGGS